MSEPHGVVPTWLEHARRLLHESTDARARMGGIAREVGVHPVHLSRAFRQHYGTTMSRYRRDLRIRHACEEIRRTEHSLSRIALAAGFADHAHFTRVFKRVNGLTPSEYRWQSRFDPSVETSRSSAASGPSGARDATLS
jgi:AraC family transcriptional regulator